MVVTRYKRRRAYLPRPGKERMLAAVLATAAVLGVVGNADEAPTGTPPVALDSIEIGQLAATCALADKTACNTACAPAAACEDASVAFLEAQAALTPPGPWATCIGYQPCNNLQNAPPPPPPAPPAKLSSGAIGGIVVGAYLGVAGAFGAFAAYRGVAAGV